MLWQEITIHTTEEAIEMISNFLHEYGAGGVSIEESGSLSKERDTTYGQLFDIPLNDIPLGEAIIKGYYNDGTDMESIVDGLIPAIEQLKEFDINPGPALISVKQVNDEDWADAWKQYFKPVRITSKLTVKPSWEEYTPSEDELIIELDPGMAFGTGTHATTSLCLSALEQTIVGGEEMIDVGTGSGILAIGAIKLGAARVLAVDLDPVAVQIAAENAELNGMEQQIQVKQSDLLGIMQANQSGSTEQTVIVKLPVPIVVANILAEIILLFIDDAYQSLQNGGVFIASGIIEHKQAEVEAAMAQAGFVIEQRLLDQQWVALIARKP